MSLTPVSVLETEITEMGLICSKSVNGQVSYFGVCKSKKIKTHSRAACSGNSFSTVNEVAGNTA
jgi:hypothetical protein